jgi:hypothetical protein
MVAFLMLDRDPFVIDASALAAAGVACFALAALRCLLCERGPHGGTGYGARLLPLCGIGLLTAAALVAWVSPLGTYCAIGF